MEKLNDKQLAQLIMGKLSEAFYPSFAEALKNSEKIKNTVDDIMKAIILYKE